MRALAKRLTSLFIFMLISLPNFVSAPPVILVLPIILLNLLRAALRGPLLPIGLLLRLLIRVLALGVVVPLQILRLLELISELRPEVDIDVDEHDEDDDTNIVIKEAMGDCTSCGNAEPDIRHLMDLIDSFNRNSFNYIGRGIYPIRPGLLPPSY